jgi:hypothetical protein
VPTLHSMSERKGLPAGRNPPWEFSPNAPGVIGSASVALVVKLPASVVHPSAGARSLGRLESAVRRGGAPAHGHVSGKGCGRTLLSFGEVSKPQNSTRHRHDRDHMLSPREPFGTSR